MTGKILIVLHQEHSSPGRIGRFLIERGYELDIRRPRFDDPLPQTMRDHAGAVIFGGPMSVNDEEAWLRREIDWIGVPLNENKPFLGVCLGAQMLTRHLGGRVSRHEAGKVEIGYWPIEPTQDGRSLMSWPSHVYHWHNEGSEHVRGTRLLATGKTFANQAFACGRAAYGLQFHPEVTYLMMNRWTTGSEESFKLSGAQDREQQFSGRYQYDPGMQQWLHGFLDLWLTPAMAVAAE